MLYVRANTLGHARLGVVVAKRLAPRAVTRNLIKRLAREAFRRDGTALLGASDCIVRLNRPVVTRQQPASTRALRRTLGAELGRLMQLPSLPR